MTVIELGCVFLVLVFLAFLFASWQGRISEQSAHQRDIAMAQEGLRQEVQVVLMREGSEEYTVRETIWVPRASESLVVFTGEDLLAAEARWESEGRGKPWGNLSKWTKEELAREQALRRLWEKK